MPRNSSGNFSLPIGAFAPGGLIKSSDLNSNFSDIATALTQSLATTGVTPMTGSLPGAPGLVSSPGYAFNGAPKTGFFLAGTNQIGWASNGVQGATFNSDLSTTWAGAAAFSGKVSGTMGTIPVGALMDFCGTSSAPAGWLFCYGQAISRTTYAAAFAAIGTTYGVGDGSTTFNMPDCRGRTTYSQDNVGGAAANRITVAGGNFDGTIIGNSGGSQNQTLTASQIPTINTSGSNNIVVNSTVSNVLRADTPTTFNAGGGIAFTAFINGAVSSSQITCSGNNTITASSNNTGGASHPILGPAIIVVKMMYVGV